jgi:hypothetical protein
MSVEETMGKYGFRISASCAGKATYTKWLKYNGKRAYIAVSDTSGENLPAALDEPVRVVIYESRSGNELEPGRDVDSLRSYLESLKESEGEKGLGET